MSRRQKKEPVELAAPTSSNEYSLTTEYSTTSNKSMSNETDVSETQLFRDDGIYQRCYSEKKGRHWAFIVYEESAPADWIQQLEQTGLPFAVAPYHDKDKNPDGSPKKEHYHIMVSYSNTTTYNNVCGLREITKGPFPQIVNSVSGMYAYFTHKHNPEKYQYDPSLIRRYNGWEKTLESVEVSAIKRELTEMVLLEEITDYAELIATVLYMDGDYQTVAMNNTVYFDRLCSSYRHNRLGTLKRFYNNLPEGNKKENIYKIIEKLDRRNEVE